MNCTAANFPNLLTAPVTTHKFSFLPPPFFLHLAFVLLGKESAKERGYIYCNNSKELQQVRNLADWIFTQTSTTCVFFDTKTELSLKIWALYAYNTHPVVTEVTIHSVNLNFKTDFIPII